MDPYLEGSHWGSFHVELSVEIRRQLSLTLPTGYHVLTMPRFISETSEDVILTRGDIYPDPSIFKEHTLVWETTPSPPVQIVTVMPAEQPHYVVEIRTVENQHLVTSLEVLSPANKRGQGYRDYLNKRDAILRSDTHLIEIDWLRNGRRPPMRQPLPEAAYFVFLSRAEKRPVLDVWPISLTDKLPIIPVPLLAEDDDVHLDLQLVFTAVYDSVGYEKLLDYVQAPEIALMQKMAVWADTLLQAAGLRKTTNR
jgi:hypothetical protein